MSKASAKWNQNSVPATNTGGSNSRHPTRLANTGRGGGNGCTRPTPPGCSPGTTARPLGEVYLSAQEHGVQQPVGFARRASQLALGTGRAVDQDLRELSSNAVGSVRGDGDFPVECQNPPSAGIHWGDLAVQTRVEKCAPWHNPMGTSETSSISRRVRRGSTSQWA